MEIERAFKVIVSNFGYSLVKELRTTKRRS